MGESQKPLSCKPKFIHLIMSCFTMANRHNQFKSKPTTQSSERRDIDDALLGNRMPKPVGYKCSINRQYIYDTKDVLSHQPLNPQPPGHSVRPHPLAEYEMLHSPSSLRLESHMNFMPSFILDQKPNSTLSRRATPPSARSPAGLVSLSIHQRIVQLQSRVPPIPEVQFKNQNFQVHHRYYRHIMTEKFRSSSAYRSVGDPALRIYRIYLPPQLIQLLDEIVGSCERHAATLPKGWYTDLYSLTKQDIALRDIPSQFHACKPIMNYIRNCMLALWGVQAIKMDRNQPHVLKYSAEEGHTGVELHHDKCDVTANLCLSKPRSYIGGG